MFNISVLLDVQANKPETSLFFVCPNGFGEPLFSNVYSMYLGCITLELMWNLSKKVWENRDAHFRASTIILWEIFLYEKSYFAHVYVMSKFVSIIISQRWKKNCSIYAISTPRLNLSINGLDQGLRIPNKGINQRNLKIWADVADKICFGRT